MPPYQEPQSNRKAASLISTAQFENTTSRSMASNLICLQTMILMAIEADNHGPPNMRNQGGPSQAVWLGSAIGLAYSLKLHVPNQKELSSDGDPDSDEKLARRCWLVLVTLDKFNASGTSSPGLIPDASVVILPEDQQFGEGTFHLTSKSFQNLVYRLLPDDIHRTGLDSRSRSYYLCGAIRCHSCDNACRTNCRDSFEWRARAL